MPERALLSVDSASAHVINAVCWVGACVCLYLLVRGLVSPCLRVNEWCLDVCQEYVVQLCSATVHNLRDTA